MRKPSLKDEFHAKQYCSNCVKFNGGKCTAFTELYPLWGKGECFGKVTDPKVWRKHLEEMEQYRMTKNGREAGYSMRREINRMEDLTKERAYEDLNEVYHEDLKRGKAGGGGEKADRTNKTFGPQQMKDNRFMHRKRNPAKYRG